MNGILKRVAVLGVGAVTMAMSFSPILNARATGDEEPDLMPVVNVTGLAEEDGRIEVRNSATDADKVDVVFETLWHMKFVGDIMVNEQAITVADYIDYDNQSSYLSHYNGQVVSFSEQFDRAEDNIYNITVTTARNEVQHIGNFLWTADPEQKWERHCERDEETEEELCEYVLDENGEKIPGRNYVGNSSLALVALEYAVGGTVYSCNADEGTCSWWPVDDEENVNTCEIGAEDCGVPYVEFDTGNKEYADGSLVVPAGARLTMRVIPDYGYQVMNVNMSELVTSEDGIGEFTFTVPGGAAYFVADVVEVEDVVDAQTDLVASGSIKLGAGQTTLTHGSAKLDVNDVELSDENKAKFEEAAEEYEIKNYLDISLFNITCKGAATCTGSDEDSWSERVRDLNEEATIVLQLEDGVDGNDVVIVHEKHDGTYEVIESEYDPETRTISFRTSSFSNYAIASRTVIKAPDTGIAR